MALNQKALKCLVGAITFATCFSLAVPADADELDAKKYQLAGRINEANSSINYSNEKLDQASKLLASSRSELADAQAVLAKAEADLSQANDAEQQRAKELGAAEAQLNEQNEKITKGKKAIDEQRNKAAAEMRTMHQQNTALLSIGMLLSENGNTSDINSRVQWAQTLYNSNVGEIKRLSQMQLDNQKAQEDKAVAENQARQLRDSAAQQVETKKAASLAAQNAKTKVNELVAANEQAEASAKQAVNQAISNRDSMQDQMNQVTQQINARDAAAERRAAQIEAARQAEQAAKAQQQSQAARPAPAPAPSRSGRLFKPANGPYTSPFGWRFHPILKYSMLHTGTDIGAPCGAPIYAAESGVVVKYVPTAYSGGYGNRVVIDHGVVGGNRMTAAYNHATSFVVGVGQSVSRGQVIGYVGTTGYSTGCHLDFELWVNGQITDAAPYL